MKNKNITIGIISVVLIIAAFFVGKSYGASHAAATAPTTGGGFNRTGMTGGAGGGRGGGTMGQVVSMDVTSITVSTPGGGSKIILYSPTTTVAKSTQGTIKDITVGSIITANGPANTDGSITANAIQIRPTGSLMPGANSATPAQ